MVGSRNGKERDLCKHYWFHNQTKVIMCVQRVLSDFQMQNVRPNDTLFREYLKRAILQAVQELGHIL